MRAFLLSVAMLFASTPSLLADDHPVVIELFTSQGCSSCPPADALMHKLAARDDVIALALHVDYWDYIGWKDKFANPAFTKRQRGYARAAGTRTIYTPQMIVGGQDHVVGYDPMKLTDFLKEHAQRQELVQVDLKREGDVLSIAAQTDLREPMVVQLVRYQPNETVAISRGENRGKTIDYANIVREWHMLGQWSGEAGLSISHEIDGDMPIVVLIQRQKSGAVLGAARLR